jgi:hypothetical protein
MLRVLAYKNRQLSRKFLEVIDMFVFIILIVLMASQYTRMPKFINLFILSMNFLYIHYTSINLLKIKIKGTMKTNQQ